MPANFGIHSPAVPGTPDSMIFWGDPGEDSSSGEDSESEDEGGPITEAPMEAVAQQRAHNATMLPRPYEKQGRLNTAARPLVTAAPPPTGKKKLDAADSAGRPASASERKTPVVQVLILEDEQKTAPAAVPRPVPRPEPEPEPTSKPAPKLNSRNTLQKLTPAEPEPDDNLTKEERDAAEAQKAKEIQIANLAKRFPLLEKEEVKAALEEKKWHAGRASKILMKKVMEHRQAVDEMVAQETEAIETLEARRSPENPLPNTSHGSSLAAADAKLPSALQLTGSEAQPDINGVWVKSGTVNGRPAYLLTEECGFVLYWQYNIDVRCADGMQNQWLIADKVGAGYRAAAFGPPGGGPLDVPPRSWQVATNGSWVNEETISLSAVRVYRAARDAVATLERDLDKLGRFQDPIEGGRYIKGEKVVATQVVETGTGLRVKTAYGWVSMVAVSGVVLLEPWKEQRKIDMSGLLGRKNPPSHRTAQKFAEIDGILGLPRFPAMKPFHGAVLMNPKLRSREAPMRHGPLLPPPATSAGLVPRQPERLTKELADLDMTLSDGVNRQMAVAKLVAKQQLMPLISWSDHLKTSRTRVGLATPPSGAPPTATFRRLHPGARVGCSLSVKLGR